MLSGGGSGNYRFVLQQGMLTELQAGGAVLMDLTYESMGVDGAPPRAVAVGAGRERHGVRSCRSRRRLEIDGAAHRSAARSSRPTGFAASD